MAKRNLTTSIEACKSSNSMKVSQESFLVFQLFCFLLYRYKHFVMYTS